MFDLSMIVREFGDLARYQACPPGWVPKPSQAMPIIESLKEATVRTIGQSAGGRDILAIEYGEKEDINATTDNLQSALASKSAPPDPTDIFPKAFYGSRRRRRPAIVLQGAIHGGELTGTVASLNLCHIIETGKDLRGKAWPQLAQLARQTRLCIIPWLNPDGTHRWPLDNPTQASENLYQACTQGYRKDGSRYRYPRDKILQPIPVDATALMGAYYNDQGVNLAYDFCAIERQPETTTWMRYYIDERPDAVVNWHCDAGSMLSMISAYMPNGFQHEYSRLGGAVRSRLLREGLEIRRLSWAALPGGASGGRPILTQYNAVYHVAGAMPIMCELPAGTLEYPYTCDQLIDIGLITIEEILNYAHRDGLRPYEWWEKVKKTLA